MSKGILKRLNSLGQAVVIGTPAFIMSWGMRPMNSIFAIGASRYYPKMGSEDENYVGRYLRGHTLALYGEGLGIKSWEARGRAMRMKADRDLYEERKARKARLHELDEGLNRMIFRDGQIYCVSGDHYVGRREMKNE